MRNTLPAHIDCMLQNWSLTLNDVGALAWAVTGTYALAGVFCLGVAPLRWRLREGWFWLLLGLFLLFLAANKQLDLQTGLIQFGKCVAISNNWYEARGEVQFAVVAGLVILALVIGLRMFLKSILGGAKTLMAVIGFLAVASFFVLRAAAINKVDLSLDASVMGVPVLLTLELVGAALIFINACVMLAVTESR